MQEFDENILIIAHCKYCQVLDITRNKFSYNYLLHKEIPTRRYHKIRVEDRDGEGDKK